MEIIRADVAGFCAGVKQAVETALKTIKENNQQGKNIKVFTLGPIVHNRLVVEELASRGIKMVNTLEEIPSGEECQLIIRSHGTGPGIFQKAKEKGVQVIDATCPRVKKVHRLAEVLVSEGFKVIIIGDRHHPEVSGILEWTGGQGIIVSGPEEAAKISNYPRLGIISQTTQTIQNYLDTASVILEKGKEVRAYNTICLATNKRQNAAKALAQTVDVIVVVGGFNSANTRKLVEICVAMKVPTYHVETASQLDKAWFVGINKVGVTAGASTPEWIIEEVIKKMSEFGQGRLDVKVLEEETPRTLLEREEEQEGNQELSLSSASSIEDVDTAEKDEQMDDSRMMEEQLSKNMPDLHSGDVVTGKVVQVSDDEVLVDVGGKSEGVIPLRELSVGNIASARDVVQVGDEIEVYVVRAENDEGTMLLSKRRADQIKAWDDLKEAYESGRELAGEVIQVVKGGLLANVGVRGFVPASLIERGYVSDLDKYLGTTLRLRIIELDRSKNKVVLSQKAILDEEYEKARKELWENIEAGQRCKGIVRRLTDFGAFVDIGGVDGLLHISEMSWTHIDHPSEILQENEEIEVYILAVDKERQRISLGLKQIMPSPWEKAAEKYHVDEIITGKVVRTVPFGAFVQIEPGVEGLVHISQLAPYRVERTEDVVNAGDEIPVKILDFKPQEHRMSLSLKKAREELEANKERQVFEGYQEERMDKEVAIE